MLSAGPGQEVWQRQVLCSMRLLNAGAKYLLTKRELSTYTGCQLVEAQPMRGPIREPSESNHFMYFMQRATARHDGFIQFMRKGHQGWGVAKGHLEWGGSMGAFRGSANCTEELHQVYGSVFEALGADSAGADLPCRMAPEQVLILGFRVAKSSRSATSRQGKNRLSCRTHWEPPSHRSRTHQIGGPLVNRSLDNHAQQGRVLT